MTNNGIIQILVSFIITLGLLPKGCSHFKSRINDTTLKPIFTGNWIITEQTVASLMITPSCKGIKVGSLVKFSQDRLEVYTNVKGQPCDVFSYRHTERTISIIKDDMIFLCTYELNRDILRIKSTTFFTPDESEKLLPTDNQTSKIQEITVTLKKQNKTD